MTQAETFNCPKCKVPLQRQGRLCWCNRCAYEATPASQVAHVITAAEAAARTSFDKLPNPIWRHIVEATANGPVFVALDATGLKPETVRSYIWAQASKMNVLLTMSLSTDRAAYIATRKPMTEPKARPRAADGAIAAPSDSNLPGGP